MVWPVRASTAEVGSSQTSRCGSWTSDLGLGEDGILLAVRMGCFRFCEEERPKD
jgi:hypothetical protein